MKELIQKRTLNSKVFDNKDGTFTLEAHVGHIHYKDKTTGEFLDIDTNLVEISGGWEMKKAGYEVEIPDKSKGKIKFSSNKWSNNLYKKLQKDVKNEEFEYLGQDSFETSLSKIGGKTINNVDGVKDGKSILYEGIATDTDFKVTCGNNSFRKEIIFHSMPSFTGDILEIEFDINKNWDAVFTDKINFDDIHIRNPRVKDNEGKSQSIEIEIKSNKLVKKIPRDFLENAVYPVIADDNDSYSAGSGDGWVARANVSTWADAQNTVDGNLSDATSQYEQVRGRYDSSDSKYDVVRLFFPFDTSGIGAGATLTAGSFNAYCHNDPTNADSTDVRIVQTNQANVATLGTGDYDECGDSVDDPTEGATPKSLDDFVAVQNYSWALDATGLSWIDVEGWTKLGARIGVDCTDDQPTGKNQVSFYFTESANPDPYLSVTYTTGLANLKSANSVLTASIKSVNGVVIGNVKSINGIE